MAKPMRFGKRWRIRWTTAEGERLSEIHETRSDADLALKRHEARRIELRRADRGLVSPGTVRTFAELAENWNETRAKAKRSAEDDASMLKRHLLPAFGALPLAAITAERTQRFAADWKLSDKYLANVLTLLGTMLRHAEELGWLEKVPRIRKPRVANGEDEYTFIQTGEEIARFLRAAREKGEDVFALYCCAVHTGARAGELAGLTWSHVDFRTRLITVAQSYDGRPTKNGRTRRVPMGDELLEVMRSWRLRNPLTVVFPSKAGTHLGESARVFQEQFQQVVTAARLPYGKDARGRNELVFHDLRHTYASHFAMAGGDLFRLQKILGHRNIAMTMRYAHLLPDAFAGDHRRLSFGIPGAPANVVPLQDLATR